MNYYDLPASAIIGNRIRNERLELGMTQAQFAAFLGISPSYLGALERGTRPVSRNIMEKLHEKTDISFDYLLRGSESSLPPVSNLLAEPEHYRVKRAFNLLLGACSSGEMRECYQLVHTYLQHLHNGSFPAGPGQQYH